MNVQLGHQLRMVLGEWQNDDAFHGAITEPVDLIAAPGISDDDIAPLIGDADVLLSRRFTRGMADHAKRLRLILTPGAGTNEIDFDAVPSDAAVCNVHGHEHSIAEYVLMTMLALNRDLINMDRRLRQGDWSDRARGPQHDIRGKTLAIIGLGRIGSEVARRAEACGMRIVAATRSPAHARPDPPNIDLIVGLAQRVDVLVQADFVVVAVPLNDETAGLIRERELHAMKPSAYLINVARGPVIDEDALYDALRQRAIAGAAIDVWYQYPDGNVQNQPSARPFHELENVIMTPHIAGWTEGTFQHRWSVINDNLRRLAGDLPLINVVRG